MTDIAMADVEAVSAVLSGDPERFGELVKRHRDRVYRFVLLKVNDRTVADDLAQDTFVEAYRSLARFDGRSRFSTWLCGIALNITRNYVNRAPERKYRFDSADVMDNMASASLSPLQETLRAEQMALLCRALDALTPDLREPLLLVTLDELSYEEAGRLLGIPAGTVKSRVFRARRELRTAAAAAVTDTSVMTDSWT